MEDNNVRVLKLVAKEDLLGNSTLNSTLTHCIQKKKKLSPTLNYTKQNKLVER